MTEVVLKYVLVGFYMHLSHGPSEPSFPTIDRSGAWLERPFAVLEPEDSVTPAMSG